MESLSNTPPDWPNLPSVFSDGLLGAKFGDVAVSTPNAQVIYCPLIDKPAAIILNDDFRFGHHDPIAHPQPYHSSSPHLPVMLAPTQNGLDQLLFLPLLKSDWTPSKNEALTGLGSLNGDTPGMVIEHGRELFRKIKIAIAEAIANPYGPVQLQHLENDKIRRDIWYLKQYHRLLTRPASFEEAHFRWVNVQRLHLNLQAYFDYVTIFLPRLRSPPHDPLPVDASRSGCITTNMSTALECYYAGIPVWYVYRSSAVRIERFQRYLNSSAVRAIMEATSIPSRSVQMGDSNSNSLFSLTPALGAVAVWSGEADDPARYAVMSKIIRRELSPNVLPTPNVLPSTTQPRLPPVASSSTSHPGHSHAASSSTMLENESHSTPFRGLAKRPRSPEGPNQPNKKAKKFQKAKKAREGGVQGVVTRDRWQDVRSPIMPAAIDWWMSILEEEKIKLEPDDRAIPTFPGVSKEQATYAAPDGFIFGAISNSSTQAGSLLNYVRLRPLIHYWLESVNDPKTSVMALRAQVWRTLLGLEILGAGRTTGRAADNRAEAVSILKDALAAQSEISFDVSKIRTMEARWSDGSVLIDDGSLPPTKVCREIIWEMYELNFRSELVRLDSFVFDWESENKKREDDRVSPSERRMVVLSLIPSFNGSPVMDYDEFKSCGFAGHSPIERRIALCGLVDIMRGWCGDGALPAGMADDARTLTQLATSLPDAIEKLGKSVGQHYIRTFFKVFARPPTLPRRLVPQI